MNDYELDAEAAAEFATRLAHMSGRWPSDTKIHDVASSCAHTAWLARNVCGLAVAAGADKAAEAALRTAMAATAAAWDAYETAIIICAGEQEEHLRKRKVWP